MSLGRGCYWKGTCEYYARKANSYHKNNYCNNDFGCDKCPHRPINNGNEQVQRSYQKHASAHGTIKLGQILLGLLLLSGVLKIMGIL